MNKNLQHFAAAQSKGWWDGPENFGNINRNPISWIQRSRDFEWIFSLFQGGFGLEIGGPGNKDRGCYGVSPIEGNATLKLDGRTLEGVKDCSINYIVSTHVFEHIDQDPILTLKRWHQVLKVGGMILIIMPDKTHFKHDPNVTKEFDSAPNEMNPDDMRHILGRLDVNLRLLSIDTHKNNFDFETILLKG